jgi:hypothetical protein
MAFPLSRQLDCRHVKNKQIVLWVCKIEYHLMKELMKHLIILIIFCLCLPGIVDANGDSNRYNELTRDWLYNPETGLLSLKGGAGFGKDNCGQSAVAGG